MKRKKIEIGSKDNNSAYSGFCPTCGRNHRFPGTCSPHPGYALIDQLSQEGQIGDTSPTEPLFGEMRGKMFGVMTCLGDDGLVLNLRAFSGQFNGSWQAAGWVPPLFDVEIWNLTNMPGERAVKHMEPAIRASKGERRKQLLRERRDLSRNLMKDLHALYRLTNFSGKTVSLTELFPEARGIPTGTGDCCAPKLLNYAASHNLIPLSICEFYWGRENKSGTRRHGDFYQPCQEKCAPLLGFMLCGLEEIYETRNL